MVLDTPHYGGGANTICDALAAGTPVVTLPGRFHRGRYAEAACRRLREASGALFEDQQAVAEHREFFLHAAGGEPGASATGGGATRTNSGR